MTVSNIILRPMRREDLDACMELNSLAGWNQLRRDWELFSAFNPSGCTVACAGDRVLGTVTRTDYQQRFAWIGMVLVHPDVRRRGIGTALLKAALASRADTETIKLDATPTGKELYLGLGFVDEYGLTRMTARTPLCQPLEPCRAGDIVPMVDADLLRVAALDTPVFGADRSLVLRAWYERTPGAALVLRRGERILGFVLGRPGANFATIGPLVAPDLKAARALVCAALQSLPGTAVGMDILDHTPAFRAWLEQRGFAPERPFIRMARGPNRFPGTPAHQWAILGPEVG